MTAGVFLVGAVVELGCLGNIGYYFRYTGGLQGDGRAEWAGGPSR